MPSAATEDPSAPQVGESPTVAVFSPASTYVQTPAQSRQRSTILVHQKSPLLVATPPQITRALAYSHPYLLPLNKLVGLISWSTGDPWESFLLVAAFWAVTLYGDALLRYAGPLFFAIFLIVGMWSRRYSPLSSSTGTTTEVSSSKKTKAAASSAAAKGHSRNQSDGANKHHKSLDEIVDTLKLFTARCNILLDPFIRLTDFLSTQRTATSATTRPALTSLFLRILLLTPLWYLLTLPPLYLITPRRTVLFAGTLILSWHSRPASISRAILWRSRLIRRAMAAITGLHLVPTDPSDDKALRPPLPPRASQLAARLAGRAPPPEGVRLTWTLWENQRRWLGIGWTGSMLAYERASWTDDALNPAPSRDNFSLPALQEADAVAKWRWVAGSEWTVDDGTSSDGSRRGQASGGLSEDDENGWIYYDNKWRDGRRGIDGWGRYTRRRKWCRDAELVEVNAAEGSTSASDAEGSKQKEAVRDGETVTSRPLSIAGKSHKSTSSTTGGSWFRRRRKSDASVATVDTQTTDKGKSSGVDTKDGDDSSDEGYVPMPFRGRQSGLVEATWGVGDDVSAELG